MLLQHLLALVGERGQELHLALVAHLGECRLEIIVAVLFNILRLNDGDEDSCVVVQVIDVFCGFLLVHLEPPLLFALYTIPCAFSENRFEAFSIFFGKAQGLQASSGIAQLSHHTLCLFRYLF